ncbi:MAG: hypothetical protein HZA90_27405 [Verrucomicrobia bacterium]|nr:hypothetical protein [Verrucomicrobiota bacterium]
MTGPRNFDAPWSWQLWVATLFSVAVLAGVAVIFFVAVPSPGVPRLALATTGLLGIAVASLFTIRGYEVGDHDLAVLRLGWRSRISLAGLKSVEFLPDATRKSVRLCGNGGMFAFCGWFSNGRLGRYRLFGTDPRRSVVLFFDKRRIVVTPDEPQAFVRKLREVCSLA